AVSGQLFEVINSKTGNYPILISSSEGHLRSWRNSGLDKMVNGQTAQLPFGILGNEWDEVGNNAFRPPGILRLSTTTVQVDSYLQDYGSTFGPGIATHSLTLYRHGSGALVFGAGTIHWSWGLDRTHDLS